MEELLLMYVLVKRDEEKAKRRKLLKRLQYQESKVSSFKAIQRRRLLKTLRDTSDPFSMDDAEFIKAFRFPRSLCQELICQLLPYDNQKSTLPFKFRFLSTLYFYAHGSYQKRVGNNNTIPLSQPSVSRSIEYISDMLITAKEKLVRFPQTRAKLMATKTGFYDIFGIRGTIGAIDCTHIAINAPTESINIPLKAYMNQKDFYSINVEAVCDHNLCFTAMNAKFPGGIHDSIIWTKTPLRKALIKAHNSEEDSWLIGDYSYPLEPWLITPVSEPSTRLEVEFNKIHAKARKCTIEWAFVLLKSRFQCLANHRKLHYSHAKAAKIAYACGILHNILISNGVALKSEDLIKDKTTCINENDINLLSSNFPEGRRIRSRYIASLFESYIY